MKRNSLARRRCFSFVLLGILSFAGLISCQTLTGALSTKKQSHQVIKLKPQLIRLTTKNESFGFRAQNRVSPLLVENLVIQGNGLDGVVAYNRKSGTQKWRFDIENGIEGGIEVAGTGSDAVLFFGGGDGFIRAVQLATGKLLWQTSLRAEVLSTPTFNKGILIAQTGADVVYGLEAVSGKLLWTYNRQVTSNLSIRAATRPTVVGENVLVGFSDGFLVSLTAKTGAMQWARRISHQNRFQDVDSTPIIKKDHVFVASYDGTIVSVQIDTGSVLWESEFGGYNPVALGTGTHSDRIYFSTVDGRVVELDEATGKLMRTFQVKDGIATQPVVFNGYMIFGESAGALRVIDLNSFQTVAQYQSGHGLMAAPTVDQKNYEIWFMSSGASLYSLNLTTERSGWQFPWNKADSSLVSDSF